MTRNWWFERLLDDGREKRLPKWARERLNGLRAEVRRLMRGVREKRELGEDERVYLSLGSDGHGGSLASPLPNDAQINFKVTGGEMHVHLSKFGNRYKLRVTGFGEWDHMLGDRPEIAVLPAMGNVVEVAFVMPVPDVVHPPMLAIESPATPEIGDRRVQG